MRQTQTKQQADTLGTPGCSPLAVLRCRYSGTAAQELLLLPQQLPCKLILSPNTFVGCLSVCLGLYICLSVSLCLCVCLSVSVSGSSCLSVCVSLESGNHRISTCHSASADRHKNNASKRQTPKQQTDEQTNTTNKPTTTKQTNKQSIKQTNKQTNNKCASSSERPESLKRVNILLVCLFICIIYSSIECL